MLIWASSGCGRNDQGADIPRERLVQIYGEMLFLAELHRQDTTGYRAALDSLCRANGTDTAQIAKAIRVLSEDRKDFGAFHDSVAALLARKARIDARP
jgi:hypothetical protein